MKMCNKCKLKEVRSPKQYTCKDCHNEYQKAYYKRNPQSINKSAKDRKQERLDLVRSYKNKPCMDCKKSYPWYVMDFDHVRGIKKFDLSTVSSKHRSTRVIMEELEKCELVCSNCHRERTFSRIGLSNNGSSPAFEAEDGGSIPSKPAMMLIASAYAR